MKSIYLSNLFIEECTTKCSGILFFNQVNDKEKLKKFISDQGNKKFQCSNLESLNHFLDKSKNGISFNNKILIAAKKKFLIYTTVFALTVNFCRMYILILPRLNI